MLTRVRARPPIITAPRKHNATTMNATAVPCPAATRNAIPTATVATHTTIPARADTGARTVAASRAVTIQPASRPSANGHAVETNPATVSPWWCEALPMATNAATAMTSTPAAALRIARR